MKFKTMKSLVLLFFLLAITLACNKESDSNVTPKGPSEKFKLLTKQPWNQEILEFGIPGNTVIQFATDGNKYFLDFSKSQRTFKTDNTLENRDYLGTITPNITWKLISEENEIEIYNPVFNRTTVYKLDLNETRVVFSKIFNKTDTPIARWTELTTILKNIGYTGTYNEIVLNETFKAEK
jgi:hypothetical protein